MYEIVPILDALSSHASANGGWGYAPDKPPHLEPTCLGLLALSLEPAKYQDPIAKAQVALQSCLQADGAYRAEGTREEAIWPTSLALFTRAALGASDAEIEKTVARLLGLRGRQAENITPDDMHDIDLKITGWPWGEGNFSWVEPTAWACLALRRAGQGEHPRVEEGLRLLLDRALDEGGINYGNRRIFGRNTEPIPGPTAVMLLALQGKGDQPRVTSAIAYLMEQAKTSDDLEHLCWAKLALDAYWEREEVAAFLPVLDERIVAGREKRAETSYLRAAPLREALAALALGTERRNPFRLAGSEAPGKPVSAAAPTVKRRGWGERIGTWFRGVAIKATGGLKPLPPQSTVHIAPATDYNGDLAGLLQRQFESFRARVPLAGKRVVLKPNLVEYHRDKVINTNPLVVAAVIELCKREGAAEVIVAEGPGHWRNVEYLVGASGLGDVLRHYKVPFVDLNHDEPVKTPNLGRLTGMEYLYLTRTVVSADVLISLPKLKTHHWAGATLSLKNLFGTLPGICYGWPKNELHWRGIDNSIVDIALTRTPDLAIVDGIVGMEGDGPLNGTAKPLGAIIMGNDPLAVDATCCRLMRLDPERMGSFVKGYQKKLGRLKEAEIQQLGETIESLAQPFETIEHFKVLCMGQSA